MMLNSNIREVTGLMAQHCKKRPNVKVQNLDLPAWSLTKDTVTTLSIHSDTICDTLFCLIASQAFNHRCVHQLLEETLLCLDCRNILPQELDDIFQGGRYFPQMMP